MSLLAMSAPRSSVFTFESTVHSCHVLRCLDDQRRRDMLCDVTLVVEGQSFRAHRSVLASCSEYFTHRISSHTQHGAVITLPEEVTVAGFEPLLKFAYTSKLLFSKENALEIQNSASILGFRDLDNACFDFLLPKFLSSSRANFQRKTCCKKKCKRQLSKEDCGTDNDDILMNEKEEKPVADSPSEQEVAWLNSKSVNSQTGSKSSASTLPPVADAPSEGANDNSLQCPKYRKFQLACGKEICSTEKSLDHPASVIEDARALSCLPCFSSGNCKNETKVEFPGQSLSNPDRQEKGEADEPFNTESNAMKIERDVGRGEADKIKRNTGEREGERDERGRKTDCVKIEEEMNHISGVSSSCAMAPLTDRSSVKGVSLEPSAALGERSSGLILYHCPLKAFGKGSTVTESVSQKKFVMDITEGKKPRDSGVVEPTSIHQKEEEEVGGERRPEDVEMDPGWQERGRCGGSMENGERETSGTERSSVEKEVAEHLAKRLGSDRSSPSPMSQDPDTSSASDSGTNRAQSPPLDWLKLHVNLSSTSTSCPFLQNFDQSKSAWRGSREAKLPGCDGVSQCGKSPAMSSLNSGEDGDSETETEGDLSESYTTERARQVQLPFSVDWVVDLSRNDFQQLLKQQSLTREQLDFVHDMRRRSKNRIAAQRCRKRKLDCIYNLQCEIHKLKTEKEKLMAEKSQLSQLKSKACHSVSALCQRVCSEANLQPEQLQVLAKYTSPECPLSSFFPHIDSLLLQPGVPLHPQASLSACSSGLDSYKASLGPSSSASRDTVTRDGQHSGDGQAP